MKQTSRSGSLMLLAASIIWGSAFVAQSMGMEHIRPFTFQAIRALLGALSLLPVILIHSLLKRKKGRPRPDGKARRKLLAGSLLSGSVLFIANNLQQFGLLDTTPGKAGFLTTLYIIIVPILGLFLGHKSKPTLWISVLIAAVGLYLLSVTEQLTISRGDLLIILCAFAFAAQILLIDHYVKHVSGMKLSALQFVVCGALSLAAMFIFEQPRMEGILKAAGPLLYTGILSSGVAFTLQILAQRVTPPAIASLLMSLEAVFAVITGILVLGQVPSLREIIGSLLMFVAIIFAQRAGLPKTAPEPPRV